MHLQFRISYKEIKNISKPYKSMNQRIKKVNKEEIKAYLGSVGEFGAARI